MSDKTGILMATGGMGTFSVQDRVCSACGTGFKEGGNVFHNACPECRDCEECGSEFLVTYRKALPVDSKTTEIRCLSCLHFRTVEDTR